VSGRRSLWRNVVVASSIALICSPVRAQEYGTLIRRNSAEATEENARAARITLRQFGQCAIQSAPRVRSFLNKRMDAPGYSATLTRLATPNCLTSGMLKIPQANMRAALFEALYNKEYRAASHVFAQNLKSGFAEQYVGDQPDNIRTVLVLEQVGECVSKRDAGAARALLRTRPSSDEEDRAFATLVPHLQACIPQGQTFTLSKTVARGAVAEGLYWLTKALEAAPGAPH
jgi:hypothetical protein